MNFLMDQQGLLQFEGLIYISTKMRQAFMQEQHSLLTHGHQGINRIFNKIQKNYYFSGMKKQIQEIITEYNLYNKSKLSRHTLYRFL